MGIPSYYKRLCQSVKGLVMPHRLQDSTSFKVNTLVFDFNCMIYQVVRNPEFPPFPGYHDEFACSQWEKTLCEKVVDYTLSVWKICGKPQNVFLGLDGVVPMAKIRQQRLRRFKSIWTAAQDSTSATSPRWDTNALTPGTAFMKLLGSRLQELCTTRKWTLSDTSEPGEGEHKCMRYLRELQFTTSDATVIYGLDADLILLSLLHAPKNTWLLREVTEWEGGKDGSKAVSEFMRLSIDKLLETYTKHSTIPQEEWKLDYIAGMSLLGNDFVPHSLTFKIREKGHDKLLEYLQKIHSQHLRLTSIESNRVYYNLPVLQSFVHELAIVEEKNLLEMIKKKAQFINHEDSNLAPCEWAVEQSVLCESKGVLHTDWNTRMKNEWFGKGLESNLPAIEYLKGLQWILDYYTYQKNTDMFWMYCWCLPPSWQDISSVLKSISSWQSIPFSVASDIPSIRDFEQLAIVLPSQSWHLIQKSEYKDLPQKLPQFWPTTFGFFSAGRTFLWECEPLIPILTVERVRKICQVRA